MSAMFKIFIGNVSFKTTEEQLREVFLPHLEIEDLIIARDEATGRSKGYGFVLTRDPDQGRRAMDRLGKFEIDGRLIYLKESHGGKKPKPRFSNRSRPPRRGGRRPHAGSRRPHRSGNPSLQPTVRPTDEILRDRRAAIEAGLSSGYVGLNDQPPTKKPSAPDEG